MQIIFQDPYASLDPRLPIGESIMEGLRIHRVGTPADRVDMVIRTLKRVGLEDYHARRYPHEFSGGQRQRIGIARALVLNPSFIVCDEPVSALDVSIQSQVLNLLKELQEELGLTYLFIAHNLSVVEHISDRVASDLPGQNGGTGGPGGAFPQCPAPLHPGAHVRHPGARAAGKVRADHPQGGCSQPAQSAAGSGSFPAARWQRKYCSQKEPDFREVSMNHWVACWMVNGGGE
jgi:peptide/nickel transport system ATP-binding protein/oligopeptide transport system ATP-binding protein